VLPTRKTAAQLTAGDEPTRYAFEGAQATITVGKTGGVTITDEVRTQANVTTANVAASNGIVHVIDKVLVPPGVLTVVQMAQLNPVFSVLVEAVVEAGLADDLSAAGPFTVFAPTDDAFTAFLTLKGLDKAQLLALPALPDVLRYHVVADDLRAAEVIAAAPTTVDTLFTGNSLEVSASLRLVDLDPQTSNAQLLFTDIRASNGVIHVIDHVLSPLE
jgi:transforming growth factor-beta-induced protein